MIHRRERPVDQTLVTFRSRCPLACTALLALTLSACEDGRAGAGQAQSAAPRTAPPPAHDPRTFALAEVTGSSTTERRIRALQRRVRARPDADDGWLLLGQAWIRRAREASDPGYYRHAQACADVLLERSPANNAALNLRGLVLLNDHEFSAAKAAAEAIVLREPRDPTAWGTLSDAALELGDFAGAVSAVERMMEQKPGLPAYSRTAYLRWLRGDEMGALAAFRLAIDSGLDPADPEPLAWVLVQTALLFFQRGDYAGADAGFVQALEVLRDYPPALVGQARVRLAGGDAARAVALLQRAFELSPLVETGSLLVQALELAGDREGAERAYARAEREGLRGDRRSLSLLDSTLGKNPRRALELAEAERGVRGDIYTEDALAWALYRNGQFERALYHSEQATRLGTRDARLLFHRGAALLAAGARAQGRELLRQALDLNPHFEPAAAAEAARLLVGST
jgi:tetratricopeptide (TPR) repeat protein